MEISPRQARMTIDTSQRPAIATMLRKVPEATLYFWIIKIMATRVGETADAPGVGTWNR